MTYVICFPAVALATFVNFGPTATHEHRPEFKPYEYMRVRSKVNSKFDEKNDLEEDMNYFGFKMEVFDRISLCFYATYLRY